MKLKLSFLLFIVSSGVCAQSYTIKGNSYPIPEAIDLGLLSGIKCASMIIGASSEDEVGGYYRWADPTSELTVDDYNWRNIGLDGACDSWYRNGMIPIRAIKQVSSPDYIEVCGIKWAKGNLLYDAINGGDNNFQTNWKLAPEQWYYFNYADGYGQQTYDQWDNQIDHFNWGVCGPNALSIYDYAKIGNARIFTGKMFSDETCTNVCTDFSKAQYGDIAFWASKGVYRTPTMEEYHTIGDEASISFGYCMSPDNKKVYGCLFTTPKGNRVIQAQEREFTSEDLNNGLFLPFNATRLNPQAVVGHNGKLIYYGNEGRYWSSETDGGGNSNEGARSFYVQNWVEEGMDDGVHILATYSRGQACQGAPIRPVLVNQNPIVKYKLIYTIDGVEYKTYELEFGEIITPEADPLKEGYTFSGWSEIPETMPAEDVIVAGSFIAIEVVSPQCATPTISFENGRLKFSCDTYGALCHYTIKDVNVSSGIANVVSISGTTTYQVTVYATKEGYLDSEKATKYIELSVGHYGDVNGDGKVDITDVVSLVNIILSGNSSIP